VRDGWDAQPDKCGESRNSRANCGEPHHAAAHRSAVTKPWSRPASPSRSPGQAADRFWSLRCLERGGDLSLDWRKSATRLSSTSSVRPLVAREAQACLASS
jgi:hypothetical protein